MKAKVDAELCVGCGLCEDVCAEVFVMDDDVAVVKGDSVPTDAEASCREAADSCPVDAIGITD
jgi:ferredoxin